MKAKEGLFTLYIALIGFAALHAMDESKNAIGVLCKDGEYTKDVRALCLQDTLSPYLNDCEDYGAIDKNVMILFDRSVLKIFETKQRFSRASNYFSDTREYAESIETAEYICAIDKDTLLLLTNNIWQAYRLPDGRIWRFGFAPGRHMTVVGKICLGQVLIQRFTGDMEMEWSE